MTPDVYFRIVLLMMGTPPNIFDTRWSFLLKVEKNKNMRENFLKSYNRRKSEN